jgi:hypothetical protein
MVAITLTALQSPATSVHPVEYELSAASNRGRVLGRAGEAGGEPPAGRARADPLVNLISERLHDRVGPRPGQRAVQPDLGAAMAADEVGGDAVQPGPRVQAALVVGVPLAKGQQEGFRQMSSAE